MVFWEVRVMIFLGYKFIEYLSGSVDFVYYGVYINKGFKLGENGFVFKDFFVFYFDRSVLYMVLVVFF